MTIAKLRFLGKYLFQIKNTKQHLLILIDMCLLLIFTNKILPCFSPGGLLCFALFLYS